jgi:hypothetical protein
MASILSSTFEEGAPQVDGRRNVTERHVAGDGRLFTFEYLADEATDINKVLTARAAWLLKELEADDQAAAIVGDTQGPKSGIRVMRRFTLQERIAIRTRADTNAIARDFMHMFDMSGDAIYLDDPDFVAGIDYFVTLGDLTAERAAIIKAW